MVVIQKERTNHRDRNKVLEEQAVEEYPSFAVEDAVDEQKGCDIELRWLGLCDSGFFKFPWSNEISTGVPATAVALKCASDAMVNKAGCQYH